MSKNKKIQDIIKKHYSNIAIGIIGSGAFTKDELESLKKQGVNTSNKFSLLDIIYKHNFMNPDGKGPKTIESAIKQQVFERPQINKNVVDSLNETMKLFIEKLQVDTQSRIENIIRDTNDINNLFKLADTSKTTQDLIQELKATMPAATKDWQRVVLTEVSNAIGLGSVDKIVSENNGQNLDEVYVYRIPVNDSITCKWCRKFYNGYQNVPKLYRLSSLLANGSNYGKSKEQWLPVVGATHPNTRTSPIIELKPGFILIPGGGQTFVGNEKASTWIKENLEN